MSASPKAYPVVYDSTDGLQYSFETGYVPLSNLGSAINIGQETVPGYSLAVRNDTVEAQVAIQSAGGGYIDFYDGAALYQGSLLSFGTGVVGLALAGGGSLGSSGFVALSPDSASNYPVVVDQNGNVLISSAVTSPASALANTSAQLEVDSTTQGFLPPRMSTTQKNAITSPAEGLVVYDLTLHALCVYNGSAWKTVTVS